MKPGALDEGAGLYVYAIVPAGPGAGLGADGLVPAGPGADGLAPGGLAPAGLGAGIDGAALELVAVPAGIAAVVHRHDAPPFTGSGSEAERRVLEHGEVVERCWEHLDTVLPMGFNVIVAPSKGELGAGESGAGESAVDRLSAWLTRSAPELRRRLDELSGRVELRVEISLDEREAAAGSEEARRLEAEIRQRPEGVQRLMRRKLASLVRSGAEEAADRLYPECRRRLAGVSEDIVENLRGRPPEGCVTVLNVSVLVPRAGIPVVGKELGDLQAEDPAVRVRFQGPWPPFSFADVSGSLTGTARQA